MRHIVRDKVILLERGQVFELGGKKIFTFGGAASRDIQGGILDRNSPDFKAGLKRAKDTGRPFRILRESWWPQELPSEKQMLELRRLRVPIRLMFLRNILIQLRQMCNINTGTLGTIMMIKEKIL